MASKRVASTELTQDNWNEDDEPEEFGTFRQASADQLAGRQIRKARRRGVVGDAPSPGVFKGLSAFGGFGSNAATQPSFSFLSKSSEPEKKPSFDFGSKAGEKEEKADTKEPEGAKTNGTSSSNNKLFLANLKSLNLGVLQWVKQHVEENPHVNLAPVFDDYKKHYQDIKKKYPFESEIEVESDSKKENDAASEKENKPVFGGSSSAGLTFGSGSGAAKDNTLEPSKPAFSFGNTAAATEKSQEASKSLFSFGSAASTDDKSPSKKMFSFGASATDDKPKLFDFGAPKAESSDGEKKAGFSFGGSNAGFTFANAKPTTTTDEAKTEDDPSDEPPKVEVKEVKEDDALYEKKCKLYYMSDGSYVEKGVGTLFLKPAGDDGDKTQLLIRAFTNLGNILLNIILNKSVPAVRAGKNGVVIACIPNPPVNSNADTKEPVKMLIKVKTSDDADELHKKIEELKK